MLAPSMNCRMNLILIIVSTFYNQRRMSTLKILKVFSHSTGRVYAYTQSPALNSLGKKIKIESRFNNFFKRITMVESLRKENQSIWRCFVQYCFFFYFFCKRIRLSLSKKFKVIITTYAKPSFHTHTLLYVWYAKNPFHFTQNQSVYNSGICCAAQIDNKSIFITW